MGPTTLGEQVLVNPAPLRRTRLGTLSHVIHNAALQRTVSVVIVLALWQLIGSHNPYSMSSPKAIYEAAKSYLSPEVLTAFRQTLEAFGTGFGICVFAGIPLGLAMARIRLVRVALEPYVNTFYSLPMVALFPVLIIAFGVGFELRVAATVLFGIFAVVVNTYSGALNIDPAYEDASRVFVASPWKRLWTVIIPASLRYIFAGIRISFGHGMIGAVVIEIEASALGVGSQLQHDAQDLRLDKFFVVVFVLGLFSIVSSILMRAAERFLVEPWTRPRQLRSLTTGRRNRAAAAVLPGDRTKTRAARTADVLTSLAHRFERGGRALTKANDALTRTAIGRWVVRVVVLGASLTGWWLAARHASRAVLPSPISVVERLYHQVFTNHRVLGPLGQSLELLVVGFALAVVLGVVIGLAMGQFRWIGNVLDPYVSFLYALPHAVFIPVMVVWLGFDFKFGLAYVVVSATFPVIINSMQSVRSMKPEYIDTAQSFCASKWALTRTVIWPHAVPYMVTGARVAFSVSWIAVVVSEVLTSQQGLGGLITVFGNNYQTADMFAPVVVITIISVSILQFTTWLTPRLTPWAPSQLRK